VLRCEEQVIDFLVDEDVVTLDVVFIHIEAGRRAAIEAAPGAARSYYGWLKVSQNPLQSHPPYPPPSSAPAVRPA
jgi:hypothetical protein